MPTDPQNLRMLNCEKHILYKAWFTIKRLQPNTKQLLRIAFCICNIYITLTLPAACMHNGNDVSKHKGAIGCKGAWLSCSKDEETDVRVFGQWNRAPPQCYIGIQGCESGQKHVLGVGTQRISVYFSPTESVMAVGPRSNEAARQLRTTLAIRRRSKSRYWQLSSRQFGLIIGKL